MAIEDYIDVADLYDYDEGYDEDNAWEYIEILGSSDKAILVLSEDGTAWFPKSVVSFIDEEEKQIWFESWFTPEWEE